MGELITELSSGKSVNSEKGAVGPSDIGILKTSCVSYDMFDPTECKRVVDAETRMVSCPVEAGTLIVSRMNTPDRVGACGFVPGDRTNLFLPDRLWKVKLTPEVDPYLIFVLLVSASYKARLKGMASGTSGSMHNIPKDSFGNLDVTLPRESKEQRTIGSMFEQLDNLITLHQRKRESRIIRVRSFIWLAGDISGIGVSAYQPEREDRMTEGNTNAETLFCDYYEQWISVYKEGAIREVTMKKYRLTQAWLGRLIPDLKLADMDRVNYQKLINGYAEHHERQTTMDFHHQLKGALLDAVDEGLIQRDPTRKTVRAYRNRFRAVRQGSSWTDLDDERFLRAIGAAAVSREDGRLHPTFGGLLMFGNDYDIVRECPQYYLDYQETLDPAIRWTDRVHSGDGMWSGNLFDFFFRVNRKLAESLKTPFKLDGIFRVDDTPMHKAVREALANCLFNADYHGVRGVVVRRTPDKLVFENPGDIRTGIEQMRLGGVSDPRNGLVMKMFSLIDVGERAGTGVPDVFATWANAGLPEPRIEENFGEADRTILTLMLEADAKPDNNEQISDDYEQINSSNEQITDNNEQLNGLNEQITERQRVILHFVEKSPSATYDDMARAVGVSSATVRRDAEILIGCGLLKRVGSRKAGHWEVRGEKNHDIR